MKGLADAWHTEYDRGGAYMIGGTLVRSTSSGMPRDKYLSPERFDDITLRIVEAIPEYPGEITNRELCKLTGLDGPTC